MAGLTFESALIAATLLVLVGLLSVGLATRPAAAIPLLLLVEMAVSASLAPGTGVAEFHVGPTDALSVILTVATLIRVQKHVGWRPSRLLVLLMLVFTLSVLRGLASFGLQQVALSASEMLAMLSAALFFSTVRITPSLIRTLRNSFLLAFGVLECAAAVFWSQHGLDTFATRRSSPQWTPSAHCSRSDGPYGSISTCPWIDSPFRAAADRCSCSCALDAANRLGGGAPGGDCPLGRRQKNRASNTARRLFVQGSGTCDRLFVAAGPATVTRVCSRISADRDVQLAARGMVHPDTPSAERPDGRPGCRFAGWNRRGTRAQGQGLLSLLIASTCRPWTFWDSSGFLLAWSGSPRLEPSTVASHIALYRVGEPALCGIARAADSLFFAYSIGALAGLVLGLACGFLLESGRTARSIVSQRFDSLSTR